MRFSLIPREEKFFDMFDEASAVLTRAAEKFLAMVTQFDRLQERSHELKEEEHACDQIVERIITALDRTFITPLDREDIHRLSTAMDDILDLLQDCAQTISLYDVRHATPEAKRLAEICMGCCAKVSEGVSMLDNMDHAQRILAVCTDIDRLESEADHVMRSAIAKLFREEPDVRELIKLRAIYELLEAVTDRCEDVANIIEGIVIENA